MVAALIAACTSCSAMSMLRSSENCSVMIDAPAALVEICARLMAKSPDARYPTAAEAARALRDWLASETVDLEARRLRLATGASPPGVRT